jgi:hypothetical protein
MYGITSMKPVLLIYTNSKHNRTMKERKREKEGRKEEGKEGREREGGREGGREGEGKEKRSDLSGVCLRMREQDL